MAQAPLTRDRAWAYILLNLSIPGWGSFKAGRAGEGAGKMILGLGGLLLLLAWFFIWVSRISESEVDGTIATRPPDWIWQSGVVGIVISWIWTIVTSFSMLREARTHEKENNQNVPPRLSDLPKPPNLP